MRGWQVLLLGAVAGLGAGLGLWWFARARLAADLDAGALRLARELGGGQAELDRRLHQGRLMLEAEVYRHVDAAVPPAIDRTLASYGITPTLVRDVDRILAYGRRVGLLS